LRIFEDRILSINLMLFFEVVRIGGGPVAIQSVSNLPIFHAASPSSPLMLHHRTMR
jgi:hypothetical protein